MVAPTVDFSIAGSSGSGNSEPIVVSNQIQININAQDAEGIAKVEAFIDNEKVGEDTTAPYQITIDVSGYASKGVTSKLTDYVLRIDATDTSGNTSSTDQLINIVNETPLITINFPGQNINPELIEFYIFASTMDGELLSIAKVEPTDTSITLSTTAEISDEEEYMLTFAEKFAAFYGETNELATIQNIKRSSLQEINLKTNPRFPSNFFDRAFPEEFPIEGFWDENTTDFIALEANGFDYSSGGNACSCSPTTPENSIIISRYDDYGNLYVNQNVYLQVKNTDQLITSYALLNKDVLVDNFSITPDLFSDEGITLENLEYPNIDLALSNHPILSIYLYENESDYSNNIFHINNPLANTEASGAKINYWLNNNFYAYRTELQYLKYRIEHTGKPNQSYNGRDWSVSHTFENGTFMVDKNTANEDFVGRIALSDFFSRRSGGQATVLNGRDGTYRWNIVFDSQNNSAIKLPVIPVELEEWVFNDTYNNLSFASPEDYDQRQVELIRYVNMDSFEEYLQKIIKDNEKWYLISPVKESVYDNPSFWNQNYVYPNHFLIN
ncbi:Ig-like domain-containing protein [Flagellimonas marina]|uniref:Ig-like domain-containing protein n=1 Tax=Flagellimonas marina TaxID=1775168 RepID=A0ABV8PGP9_9FLAO